MLNAQVVFDKFIVFVKFRLGSSQKAAYLFAAKGNTVFRKGSFLWRLLEKHKTEVKSLKPVKLRGKMAQLVKKSAETGRTGPGSAVPLQS